MVNYLSYPLCFISKDASSLAGNVTQVIGVHFVDFDHQFPFFMSSLLVLTD